MKRFNIKYGKFFKLPRKGFKYILSILYPFVTMIYPLPKVLSIPETIFKIKDSNASICRFGDGELLYIAERRSLPFQKQNNRLRDYLITILRSDFDNILVGLPVGFYSHKELKPETRRTWRAIVSWTYPKVKPFLKKDKIYFNASFTRPYMDYTNNTQSEIWFEMIRNIWENRSILLVEGEKSRLGVGNNLFDNSTRVKRVLAPAHDAFDRYDDLLNFVLKQDSSQIVLVALGPTAKPLCFELAKAGFQAIDIGNIDIEYEWFLRGSNDKIKIPGKYTSEAIGGRHVEDINNNIYKSQIIANFTNE